MPQYITTNKAWAFPIRFISSRSGPTMVSSHERIQQALALLLKTQLGERPFHTDYGSDIGQYVFGQLDLMALSQLKEQMATVIQAHETRIRLQEINFDSSEVVQGRLHIDITYELLEDGEEYQLRLPFTLNQP